VGHRITFRQFFLELPFLIISISKYKLHLMDNDLDDKEIMNETFVMQPSANHLILSAEKKFSNTSRL
jgi:hypothetical protein